MSTTTPSPPRNDKEKSNHHHHQPNRKKQRKKQNSSNSNDNNKKVPMSISKKDENISRSLSWVLRHKAPSLGLSISSDGFVSMDDLLSCNHPRFHNITIEDVCRVVKNDMKQRYTIKEQVVNNNNDEIQKELYIRANQGHSISNTIVHDIKLLTPITKLSDIMNNNVNNGVSSTSIVHGTFKKAWINNICKNGLNKMNRNHIHFVCIDDNDEFCSSTTDSSSNISSKTIPGLRRNCEVLIYINTSMIWNNDNKESNNGNDSKNNTIVTQFFKSDNNVILTSGVNDSGVLPCNYFLKVFDISSLDDNNHGILLFDGDQFTTHHYNLVHEFKNEVAKK